MVESKAMKKCAVTKRGSIVAGGYSNKTRATKYNPTGKVRKNINSHKQRIFVPELKKTVRINVSSKGLREIKKNGVYKTLKKSGIVS